MTEGLICPICGLDWAEYECKHSIDEIVTTLRQQSDGWQNRATVLSIKLKTAVDTLRYYAGPPDDDEYNQGPARDALSEIEGE